MSPRDRPPSLEALQDAGLPIVRSLKVREGQMPDGPLKAVTLEVAEEVESGSSLSEAMAKHPAIFDDLYVNMVKAGELGGVLEVTLNRLSEFMEKAEKIKGKVKSAMFYPVAVMVVACIIVWVLMVFVIPKFEQIFKDMLGKDEKLPDFTVLVLSISHMLRDNIAMVIGCAIAFVIVFKLVVSKTKWGRFGVDWLKLRIPAIGSIINKVAIARFTRTLGTLISSGVPILQALNITKETCGNMIITNAIDQVYVAVKEGETITKPLEESKVFPPMVISMVDVGEQTGALPEMLIRIAGTYDEEVDNAVTAMTSLIEPVMIVFLAVIVGSIVIAMFLPLIVLMDKLGSQ